MKIKFGKKKIKISPIHIILFLMVLCLLASMCKTQENWFLMPPQKYGSDDDSDDDPGGGSGGGYDDSGGGYDDSGGGSGGGYDDSGGPLIDDTVSDPTPVLQQAWGECNTTADCATVRTDGKTDPLECRWNGFVDKRCLDLLGAEWACWKHGDTTGVPHEYKDATDTCEPKSQSQCNVGACNEWIRDMVVNKKWSFGNLDATKCAHCPHREYRASSYKTVNGGSWISFNKPMSDTTGRYNLIKLPE